MSEYSINRHLEYGGVGEPVSLPLSLVSESEVAPSTTVLCSPVPIALLQLTGVVVRLIQ